MRVAVIGAGPAGMTAAYELTKAGVDVVVYEAGDRVGGMARSLDLWGQRVDLGPHRFFSSDLQVNRLWLEVVRNDFHMVERLTRIYYRGRFFHYPLRPANALWNMGIANAVHCLASYLKEQLWASYPTDGATTFESWVVRRFGRRLFDMFFKSYSEKLWGIPCDQLDADFAAQRIKKFSMGEAIKHALGLGNGGHKTLVDRFAYPVGGTGMVYERMAEQVQERGGQVCFKQPVRRVVCDNHWVQGLELADGTFEPFDHVVSTMPLSHLVRGLGDVPGTVLAAADALRFRNTILVYLHVGATDLFPDQWLYVHSPELRMGRVTNFRNWVPELYGDRPTSILALEYWCNTGELIWHESDQDLIGRAANEIRSTGLLGSAPVLDGYIQRIPRCYPVYVHGYKDHLAPIVEHLQRYPNLLPIGRYGAFKYNNQDHSIKMGLLAAENIVADKGHDLWSVNSDCETYQEKALIAETGLVMANPARAPVGAAS